MSYLNIFKKRKVVVVKRKQATANYIQKKNDISSLKRVDLNSLYFNTTKKNLEKLYHCIAAAYVGNILHMK